MVRKLEVSLNPSPFEAISPFQKKRRQLFYNDGITFMSCGYRPEEMTWTCPRCSEISQRERKRRGITE